MRPTFLRLAGSLLIIALLMYITFYDRSIFWYLYAGTVLVMIAISTMQSKLHNEAKWVHVILYGVISGAVIYGLFFTGYQLIRLVPGTMDTTVSTIFNLIAPDELWKLLILVFIVAPGHELFWRGYVQHQLQSAISTPLAITFTSILSGAVFIFSGQWIWVLAAMLGSVFWGMLFSWKQSIPLLIVSHLVFNLLFFTILPFI